MQIDEIPEDKILSERIVNFYRHWMDDDNATGALRGHDFLQEHYYELLELYLKISCVDDLENALFLYDLDDNDPQCNWKHDLMFGIECIPLLIDSIMTNSPSKHKNNLANICKNNEYQKALCSDGYIF